MSRCLCAIEDLGRQVVYKNCQTCPFREPLVALLKVQNSARKSPVACNKDGRIKVQQPCESEVPINCSNARRSCSTSCAEYSGECRLPEGNVKFLTNVNCPMTNQSCGTYSRFLNVSTNGGNARSDGESAIRSQNLSSNNSVVAWWRRESLGWQYGRPAMPGTAVSGGSSSSSSSFGVNGRPNATVVKIEPDMQQEPLEEFFKRRQQPIRSGNTAGFAPTKSNGMGVMNTSLSFDSRRRRRIRTHSTSSIVSMNVNSNVINSNAVVENTSSIPSNSTPSETSTANFLPTAMKKTSNILLSRLSDADVQLKNLTLDEDSLAIEDASTVAGGSSGDSLQSIDTSPSASTLRSISAFDSSELDNVNVMSPDGNLVTRDIDSTATSVSDVSYYKRPLPSNDEEIIEHSSSKGQKLLADVLSESNGHQYLKLSEQFLTQVNPPSCGPATIAMVLNSLDIDPQRIWKGPWRWFTEDMLTSCLTSSCTTNDTKMNDLGILLSGQCSREDCYGRVCDPLITDSASKPKRYSPRYKSRSKGASMSLEGGSSSSKAKPAVSPPVHVNHVNPNVGVSIEEFAHISECNSLDTAVYYADNETTTIDDFRAHLRLVFLSNKASGNPETRSSPSKKSCRNDDCHTDSREDCLATRRFRENTRLCVAFSRAALNQTGDGHYSPIAAYHEMEDKVLILDVARFKYPPYWVSVSRLWQAMQEKDAVSEKCRGFFLLTKPQVMQQYCVGGRYGCVSGNKTTRSNDSVNRDDDGEPQPNLAILDSFSCNPLHFKTAYSYAHTLRKDLISSESKRELEELFSKIRETPLFSEIEQIIKERRKRNTGSVRESNDIELSNKAFDATRMLDKDAMISSETSPETAPGKTSPRPKFNCNLWRSHISREAELWCIYLLTDGVKNDGLIIEGRSGNYYDAIRELMKCPRRGVIDETILEEVEFLNQIFQKVASNEN